MWFSQILSIGRVIESSIESQNSIGIVEFESFLAYPVITHTHYM